MPTPDPETVYRGRPAGIDPPVGRRAVRGPALAVALLYVAIAVAALLLRGGGA